MIKVSVIIPVYNSEKTLNTVINQLNNQTSKNLEAIFVDDGSTDNSAKLINEISNDAFNYQYIYQENSGVGEARNKGIENAQGQYLMFLDPDDQIEDNFIEKGLELIENHDLAIMAFDTVDVAKQSILNEYRWFENTSINFDMFLNNFSKLYNSELLFSLWNKVYKKSIVMQNKIEFSNIRMGEDFLFNMEYFEFIRMVNIDRDITYHYLRYSDGTATTSYRGDEFQCNYENQKYMIRFLNKFNIYDESLVSLHWALILAYRFSDVRKLKNINHNDFIKARQQYFQILSIYSNEKLVKVNYLPFIRKIKFFIMQTKLNRLFI
ncbi:glycosyltransferase family 2 protein [Leuconostoc lactis]|uniref:glycosyltransferase family 2 protein n=1 Tax=Leuconostoc lactis TaxID=1246 RepID=UPI003744E260